MMIFNAWLAVFAAASVAIPSSRELGKAEAPCRPDENGPAFIIDVVGLKDRSGLLKLEVYPANDDDFLQDDNILVSQGKAFRRLELAITGDAPIQMCIRVPAPGPYAVSLLHDRDSNRKFGVLIDGIGFGQNPKIGWRKPKADEALLLAGPQPKRSRIVLNYSQKFLSFGPVGER
ncbi:MAG: hypothetical protein BGP00_07115 [Novosphingobium sp. 63-713]|jgi:uncharacterized protein (DUF2141 family)|nr:MAG: hypothetical protein BGP00_07115 [Novosphingobium sp. 63-713]